MRSGFRFDPPQVEVSADLRWLLWRAFGPAEETLTRARDLDVDAVTDLARRFDLAARVGARTPTEILEAELGHSAAEQFRNARLTAAARYLIADQVCREIAERGRLVGIPLVYLKGAALHLGGKLTPGSRNMGDIDVLAPEDGARRLQAALVESGCAAFDSRESEHQLQFLAHRSGIGIEVHKIIPGVRLAGESSVTVNELVENGLVHPAPGMGDACYLPNNEVMLAHALVHGIAQHGLSPQAYPMTRMLADVQDLCAEDHEWQTACRWIEHDTSRDEVEAVAGLAECLVFGEDPAAVAANTDAAGTLLRHLIAGSTDESYLHSLKFRSLRDRPRDMGRSRAMAKTMRGALLPTKAQIDILYGRPKKALGYWGWRLWRPFDLVLRALRYGVAWFRQRLQKR